MPSKARSLAVNLSQALFKDISYYWTTRNTFGYVFTDFEFTRTSYERVIGKGERDLFENTKNDYLCLVLSKTLDKNFRVFNLERHLGIMININYFKEFLTIIRDRKNTVKLFLYKFSTQSQEELIRNWLRNYTNFEEIRKETLVENIDSMIDVIKKHKIEKSLKTWIK